MEILRETTIAVLLQHIKDTVYCFSASLCAAPSEGATSKYALGEALLSARNWLVFSAEKLFYSRVRYTRSPFAVPAGVCGLRVSGSFSHLLLCSSGISPSTDF